MLTADIVKVIIEAEAKTLATSGPHGIHAVPVSVVAVERESIYLYNFFMNKTVDNLCSESEVALSVWSGLEGVQVKARASYVESGALVETAAKQMKERFPDRVLRGVIVLEPHTVYDVSADLSRAGRLLLG